MKLVLFVAAVAACKGDGPPKDWEGRAQGVSSDDPPPPEEEDWGEDESGGTGTAMALEEGKMGKKDSDRAEGQYKLKKADGFGFGRSGHGPGGGGSGYGTLGGAKPSAAPEPAAPPAPA
ncbi:MAG: hypothetical protein K8M05_17225, partial [Deltaproteobacteria bacterium]|nr:hypothetical protein [Kofleriaceae bacterium]